MKTSNDISSKWPLGISWLVNLEKAWTVGIRSLWMTPVGFIRESASSTFRYKTPFTRALKHSTIDIQLSRTAATSQNDEKRRLSNLNSQQNCWAPQKEHCTLRKHDYRISGYMRKHGNLIIHKSNPYNAEEWGLHTAFLEKRIVGLRPQDLPCPNHFVPTVHSRLKRSDAQRLKYTTLGEILFLPFCQRTETRNCGMRRPRRGLASDLSQ